MNDVLWVALCVAILVAVYSSAVIILELRRCDERYER